MNDIKILIDREPYKNIYLQGNIFIDGEYNNYNKINKIIEENDIKKLDGCFSLVVETKESIIACCDKYGSFPLFYYHGNDGAIISNDIQKIIHYMPKLDIDTNSIDEYKNMGFVARDNTFFKGIKRILAGQKIIINKKDSNVLVEEYYKFNSPYSENINDYNITYEEFKESCINLSQKLNGLFKDKRIMLPLSDGSDSKLLSIILFLMEDINVISYTYGKENSSYVEESKRIAERLNFNWEFYKYKKSDWKELRKSDDFLKYLGYSGKYCQFTHFQDFLAVKDITKKMTEEERKNTIFVPGHTGVIGGGNLPRNIFDEKYCTKNLVKKYIARRDFNLKGRGSKAIKSNEFLNAFFDKKTSYVDLVSFFQKWDMQERQSKMIIASVSVYEFFGCSWYLPLVHNELTDLFYNLNIKKRVDKFTYKNYVNRLYNEVTTEGTTEVTTEVTTEGTTEGTDRRKNLIMNSLKIIYERFLLWKQLFIHDLNWFSLFTTKEKFEYIYVKGYGFPSLISKIYISNFMKYLNSEVIECDK